jgi:two-component system, chemotaxis family, protein-glutamate methylesterase/glutaminase
VSLTTSKGRRQDVRARTEPPGRDIVVVGASAGGVEALRTLVARLPEDFPAAMFVVLHVPPTSSVLPAILTRAGRLPAAHARDGDELRHGQIYIAPPDYHLLLEDDVMRLARGPRENGHRPAVDPLFRTAAIRYGPRVTAVLLSGSLDDGVTGLGAIKRFGGAVIVQDPADALYDTMPRSAVEAGLADYVLPISEIPETIVGLITTQVLDDAAQSTSMESDPTQLDPETITAENRANGALSGFVCPECKGPLWELREADIVKLRCRVGHTFTEESLEREQAIALEGAMWTALTALVEKADFSRRLADRFRRGGHVETARRYESQSRNALEQANLIRTALRNLELAPAAEELRAS